MTNRNFGLLVGALVALFLAGFYLFLGEAARLSFVAGAKAVITLLWGIVILVTLIAVPWFLGGLTRNPLMKKFDERVDKGKWLQDNQHIILGVIAAGIIGLLQTQFAIYAPVVSSWVGSVYRFFGWSGAWEVTPLWWMVYGFVAASITYWSVHQES